LNARLTKSRARSIATSKASEGPEESNTSSSANGIPAKQESSCFVNYTSFNKQLLFKWWWWMMKVVVVVVES